MATANDVLRIAAGEIGYYAPNDPEPGSKYGRWLAEKWNEPWLAGPSTSIWWCMIFVSWCFDQAKMEVPGLPTYNTDLFKSKAGAIRVPNIQDAKPGDIVIFDWNKATAATDHVGIVELNCGSYIQTIEGNTSGSNGGSQSSGNGVWRRTRNWSVVDSVYRPVYSNASKPVTPSKPAKLEVDGFAGTETIKSWQKSIGTYVDGKIDSQDVSWKSKNPGLTSGWEWVSNPKGSPCIKDIQKWLNKKGYSAGTEDGLIGSNTIKALQRYARDNGSKGEVDGVLDGGSPCIKTLQSLYNVDKLFK